MFILRSFGKTLTKNLQKELFTAVFIANKIFLALLRSRKFACRTPIGCARARKTSEARPIFWARIFCLKKRKIYFIYKYTVKKIKQSGNSKYYREHQCTFNNIWDHHIWWSQNWFLYSWIEKHLIDWNKSEVLLGPANIYDGTFWKKKYCNLNVNYSRKKFHLRYLAWVENVPLQVDTPHPLKFKRIYLSNSKEK